MSAPSGRRAGSARGGRAPPGRRRGRARPRPARRPGCRRGSRPRDRGRWCATSSAVSTIQVLNVVNAPRKPIAANGRTYRVGGQISSTNTSNTDSASEPLALMANVAQGNPSGGGRQRPLDAVAGGAPERAADGDRGQDPRPQPRSESPPSPAEPPPGRRSGPRASSGPRSAPRSGRASTGGGSVEVRVDRQRRVFDPLRRHHGLVAAVPVRQLHCDPPVRSVRPGTVAPATPPASSGRS